VSRAFVWAIAGLIVVGTGLTVLFSVGDTGVTALDIGTFTVLAVTLIALVFYAADTNRQTKIAQAKWERDAILSATYTMRALSDVGHSERTIFVLTNPTTMLIRAKVWADCRVYGRTVDPGNAYNGTDTWILFPQQTSQGWFSIVDLLAQQGKNFDQMRAESSSQNSITQLTLDLTLEFRDERGTSRRLPTRTHHYSFADLAWIPVLTRNDDDLWQHG